MKEMLDFVLINGRKLFIHHHSPIHTNQKCVLFLNPLFDEKKRVQTFQAETARALCSRNYHVFRFDYYGTGDSGGETYEFDFDDTLNDINSLLGIISDRYNVKEIAFFGIRLSSDLALHYVNKNPSINTIFLIEPIVDGKRYLLELRMQKKAFYSLNGMSDINDKIKINNEIFEDFQGYPLSNKSIKFIEAIKSNELNMENKQIMLLRTGSLFNKKNINSLIDNLNTKKNKVEYFQDNTPEFWASLETVDTSRITRIISDCFY
jgi:hypothetical protein